MIGKQRSLRLARKASLLVAVRIILATLTLVFAASMSITSTTYQAEIGSALNVANGLVAIDKGFSVAPSNTSQVGTSCGSPVQFGGSPGVANTQVVQGDLVYDVQVNSTSDGAIANKNFTVTLVLGSSIYGPLCIQGAATPTVGQTIDCRFDVGPVLPSSPYTFKVTIQ
jgi:hypothetical protein